MVFEVIYGFLIVLVSVAFGVLLTRDTKSFLRRRRELRDGGILIKDPKDIQVYMDAKKIPKP